MSCGCKSHGSGPVDYIVKEHGYVAALPCVIEYAHLLSAYSALRLTYARILTPA